MVASIGKIASPAQGVGYFEKDGYYAKDDAAHREASVWEGRGAASLGLSGPVDPERFRAVLEGEVPGGRRLGRKELDGSIVHRPGRNVILSAPKSVSLMAMVGGDGRIVEAHDRAVKATLGWIENSAVETRMRDPATGAMAASAKTGLCAKPNAKSPPARSRNRATSTSACSLPALLPANTTPVTDPKSGARRARRDRRFARKWAAKAR